MVQSVSEKKEYSQYYYTSPRPFFTAVAALDSSSSIAIKRYDHERL